eukprot:COSAG01_NODE_28389_length_662_cov_0.971581_1_plen_38_part_10
MVVVLRRLLSTTRCVWICYGGGSGTWSSPLPRIASGLM